MLRAIEFKDKRFRAKEDKKAGKWIKVDGKIER